MKIEDLTKEEKEQLFKDLLKDRLNDSPGSKQQLFEDIENIVQPNIERSIDEWANFDEFKI